MKTFQLDCGRCKKRFNLPLPEASVHSTCPECGSETWVEAFPALLKEDAPIRRGEGILLDDESSCFYHPSKKAVVACDGCGRFLCSLCDIEFSGQNLCSSCIERRATKGKMERLQNERFLYDEVAITLAVVPLILFWISFLTAPIALFVAIRYWKSPRSVVNPSRWLSVAAIVVAGLQVAGWGFFGARLLSRLF